MTEQVQESLAKIDPLVLAKLAGELGVEITDPSLYELALTHRSYAFEEGGLPHNERLEFLGDSVLGLIVTDLIYRRFPDLPEGDMAKLKSGIVNMTTLADASRRLHLGECLLLGKGEQRSGGGDKTSILCDAFEAVLGAVYLDLGIQAAEKVVKDCFEEMIDKGTSSETLNDFKTTLQEEAVKRTGDAPDYKVHSSGPDHAKRFDATVFVAGKKLGEGAGRSKKEAEQAAAREALAAMGVDA